MKKTVNGDLRGVNQEDFEVYEKVRVSGETNMFDVYKVMRLSGRFGRFLTREKILVIMKNYNKLKEKYGK